jgi:hypothetical protein
LEVEGVGVGNQDAVAGTTVDDENILSIERGHIVALFVDFKHTRAVFLRTVDVMVEGKDD